MGKIQVSEPIRPRELTTMQGERITIPVPEFTDALTGIGRAKAFEFARHGARLIVSGRREEAGRALVKETA